MLTPKREENKTDPGGDVSTTLTSPHEEGGDSRRELCLYVSGGIKSSYKRERSPFLSLIIFKFFIEW